MERTAEELLRAIPQAGDPGEWRENAFVDERIVPVAESGRIEIRMQYPLLGVNGALSDCLLRETAYERLQAASELLPEGYRLRIWDAYRPLSLQQELYNIYYRRITEYFKLDSLPEDERIAVIGRYVCYPSSDPEYPPVHTTGGAIDLTVTGPDGNELDMGTGFDSFEEATHTSFFETGADEKIRNNRRLLYNVMTSAGFTNLPSEWWHFDYGNRFWAFFRKEKTLYKRIG